MLSSRHSAQVHSLLDAPKSGKGSSKASRRYRESADAIKANLQKLANDALERNITSTKQHIQEAVERLEHTGADLQKQRNKLDRSCICSLDLKALTAVRCIKPVRKEGLNVLNWPLP
jgi:hypothetical protein